MNVEKLRQYETKIKLTSLLATSATLAVGRAEQTAAKARVAKVAMEAKERISKRMWGRWVKLKAVVWSR